jgi:hypothetical protein
MKATRLRHSPARRRRRRLGCATSGRWAKSFVKSWNEFDGSDFVPDRASSGHGRLNAGFTARPENET